MKSSAIKFLNTLKIASNTSWRGDCPACGGNNTFSVFNDNGRLKYKCFKASCQLKGKQSRELSMEDICAVYKEPDTTPTPLKIFHSWDNNIKSYQKVMQYLEKNNCMPAYERYPNRVFFDKVKGRVVFVSYDTINTIKLAIGRAILFDLKMKWYKYVAVPNEYWTAEALCDTPVATFIVEDCASACSLSRIGNAVALCGTSYNTAALVDKVNTFKTEDVIVCLDPDAQDIAMKLRINLEGFGKFRSVKVRQLSNDAKYLSEETLKKELML